MTIEEAIQHHQKVATTFKDKDSEQLATWLTELLEYRAKAQEKSATDSDNIKVMTNSDKIRTMADKELIKFLSSSGVPFDHYASRLGTIRKMTDEELFEFLDKGAAMVCEYTDCPGTECSDCLKKWLEQEVRTDG